MNDPTNPPPSSQPPSAADELLSGGETDELQAEYRRLQERLHRGSTPVETINLLRQLAAYRHRLEALDAAPPARGGSRSTTPEQPIQPGDREVRQPAAEQPNGPVTRPTGPAAATQQSTNPPAAPSPPRPPSPPAFRRTPLPHQPASSSRPPMVSFAAPESPSTPAEPPTAPAEPPTTQGGPPATPAEPPTTQGEARSAPAVPPTPAGAASGPPMASNLVVRFLVEGPDSTDIGLVAAKIRSHFDAAWTTVRSTNADLTIDWLEFQAGSFDSAPICFELVAANGTGHRDTRRYLRSTVDAVILVVDAMPDSVRSSASFVSQALEDGEARPAMERPEMTIFAHRSERPGAMDADQVASELLVESGVRVVATTEEGSGFYYGFAVATNAAVRRAQVRIANGQASSQASSLEQLLAPLGGLFDRGDFHIGAARPTGERYESAEPAVDQPGSGADALQSPTRPRDDGSRRTRALKRLISALRTEPDEERASVG